MSRELTPRSLVFSMIGLHMFVLFVGLLAAAGICWGTGLSWYFYGGFSLALTVVAVWHCAWQTRLLLIELRTMDSLTLVVPHRRSQEVVELPGHGGSERKP